MKCKHGDRVHPTIQSWVECLLGNEYWCNTSPICDAKGRKIYRHYYNKKEYSWEQILRICELKAFL